MFQLLGKLVWDSGSNGLGTHPYRIDRRIRTRPNASRQSFPVKPFYTTMKESAFQVSERQGSPYTVNSATRLQKHTCRIDRGALMRRGPCRERVFPFPLVVTCAQSSAAPKPKNCQTRRLDLFFGPFLATEYIFDGL